MLLQSFDFIYPIPLALSLRKLFLNCNFKFFPSIELFDTPDEFFEFTNTSDHCETCIILFDYINL